MNCRNLPRKFIYKTNSQDQKDRPVGEVGGGKLEVRQFVGIVCANSSLPLVREEALLLPLLTP